MSQFIRSSRHETLEKSFVLSAARAPLPSYDALRDSNLRQYFESRPVQKFLQSCGWIDKNGNIIDRFASTTTPESIEKDIIKLLK